MSKLSRNEGGLGQVFIYVLIVVVLAIAGVTVWQLTKKSSTTNTASTASTANNVAVSSACLKIFNDKTLCSFAEHTNIDAIAYIANGTAIEGTTGTQATFTVKHDTQNNSSLTYSAAGAQMSEINFNGATYVQESGSSTWLEYTTSSLAAAAGVPNPVSNFELKFNSGNSNGYTAINDGTAACGNLVCYKYQIKVASQPNMTQFVWFDNQNYLLREYTYSNSSTGTSATITFSYSAVTITAPSPVQVVS
jgi:outer membrane lipoprotein-sorting protein